MLKIALIAAALAGLLPACAVEVVEAPPEEGVAEEPAAFTPIAYEDSGRDPGGGRCAVVGGIVLEGVEAGPRAGVGPVEVVPIPFECLEEPYHYMGDPWEHDVIEEELAAPVR